MIRRFIAGTKGWSGEVEFDTDKPKEFIHIQPDGSRIRGVMYTSLSDVMRGGWWKEITPPSCWDVSEGL